MNKESKGMLKLLLRGGSLALILLSFVLTLTTCEMFGLGLGDPIDFDPPILTLNKGYSNPMYVGLKTTLEGTVRDDIYVYEVIVREAGTDNELFKAHIDREECTKNLCIDPISAPSPVHFHWSIDLIFDEDRNGDNIPVEIVAFDRMKNSGETAIKAITLIIDIRPPMIDDIVIKRTATKEAIFESLEDLIDLEITDPYGIKSGNVNRYQNGWFNINAELSENETRIEDVRLKIYDVDYIDIPLFDENQMPGSSKYSPSWLIKEEDIINAGVSQIGSNYRTEYYNENKRKYYRVDIVAIDRGENSSAEDDRVLNDVGGFMCMWANGDIPKGLLDSSIIGPEGDGIVSRGAPLEVHFFDDDSLDWAYAGLFTIEQWGENNAAGEKPIYGTSTFTGNNVPPGAVFIPAGDDALKLDFIKTRLRQGSPVYNWEYDRYSNTASRHIKFEQQVKGETAELIENVFTGNSEVDFGKFVLFTMVSDKKLEPHNEAGPEVTNTRRETLRKYGISVVDENTPLIAFDTTARTDSPDVIVAAITGDSPEENTFPKLTSDGKFTISGYTMRENASGNNSVTKFRMAWIPENLNGHSAENYIKQVQEALSDINYPSRFNNITDLKGVQHWDFEPMATTSNSQIITPPSGKGALVTGTNSSVASGGVYKKQTFNKELSILGGQDNIKPEYKNFHYNCDPACLNYDECRQNENKLFIFYAEDNHSHKVFRQLRLLANKTPPIITVYDVSERIMEHMDGIPNINSHYDGVASPSYYTALLNFNRGSSNAVYNQIRTLLPMNPLDVAIPFKMHSRGTILKYYITAARAGDLTVQSITMQDITFDTPQSSGSVYNITNQDMTFVEYFPDESARTFLFTAVDTLGNEAFLMRNVAITNAARLESITTTTQDGSYGIGAQITLNANFSGQVKLSSNTNRPRLNVRFPVYSSANATNIDSTSVANTSTTITGNFAYQSIECENFTGNAMSLKFIFTVPEGADPSGILQTMYNGGGLGGTPGTNNRPITYPTTERSIIDVLRDPQPAFVPDYLSGNASMPNWTTNGGSLQQTKNIRLDGRRPVITGASFTADIKAPYTGNEYYFKTGETIFVTLNTAASDGKTIKPSTEPPRLTYTIGGTTVSAANTTFKYLRPSGSKALVFSLPVDDIPSDGEITAINLVLPSDGYGAIEDDVGNTVNTAFNVYTALPSTRRIYIKKTLPAAPAATLAGVAFTNNTTAKEFRTQPALVIPVSAATAPYNAWEDVRQYSVNGGITWLNFTANLNVSEQGKFTIMARYTDRAGNIGNTASQPVDINALFPTLTSVSAVQPNGWYPSAQVKKLEFRISFSEPVSVQTAATVTLQLTNRNTAAVNTSNTGTNGNGIAGSHTITGNLIAGQTNINRDDNTTIRFETDDISTLTGTNRKEMRDGLYISSINFAGLEDRYGNTGGSATATNPSTAGSANPLTVLRSGSANYECANLIAIIRVDHVAPVLTTNGRAPAIGGVSSDNTSITLTFNEPVMKGSGIITIRPRGNFAIPPVFEDSGYWLGTNGAKYYSPTANSTYVPSLYDVYNNSALNAADRNYLTEGTTTSTTQSPPFSALDSANPSLSRLRLDLRTGQSVGPYKMMTQGLMEGPGFTGAYTTAAGVNGPVPTAGRMVPDTATKWVLDYKYVIADTTTSSPVSRIRSVLNKAKYRWQEIDVITTSLSSDNRTVTIALNEPLLKGLQWDVHFPEGLFTDMAGNSAVGSSGANNAQGNMEADYWFWSNGVQAPVIRVNRRSSDMRTSNWHSNTNRSYNVPGDTTNWNTAGFAVTDDDGWGIGDFNSVHYRVESESPTATINTRAYRGTAANRGALTGAWTGNVQVTTSGSELNSGGTGHLINNMAWDAATTSNAGQWILSNLIRRSHNASGNGPTYTATTKNGTPELRQLVGNFAVFRSHNNDLTKATLDNAGTGSSVTLSGTQGVMTFDNALEASKNYIIATANVNNQGAVAGYEGVFRTIVALRYSADRTNTTGSGSATNYDFMLVEGSNIKNGMPSIAGFPVRDAEESGDNRFVKTFFMNTRQQYYWVSTEIVSEWYFLRWGGGGTHMSEGEANNYLMAGYGDMTYGFGVNNSNESAGN